MRLPTEILDDFVAEDAAVRLASLMGSLLLKTLRQSHPGKIEPLALRQQQRAVGRPRELED